MKNLVVVAFSALVLGGTAFEVAVPANAAEVVGVHVGGVGLGVRVGNGHYYDRHHHRQSYSYPSDWSTYHHRQYWYRSHPQWNDQNHHDYYRN